MKQLEAPESNRTWTTSDLTYVEDEGVLVGDGSECCSVQIQAVLIVQ